MVLSAVPYVSADDGFPDAKLSYGITSKQRTSAGTGNDHVCPIVRTRHNGTGCSELRAHLVQFIAGTPLPNRLARDTTVPPGSADVPAVHESRLPRARNSRRFFFPKKSFVHLRFLTGVVGQPAITVPVNRSVQ